MRGSRDNARPRDELASLPSSPVKASTGGMRAEDPLALPAAEFLAALPWDGALPDPDSLDAASFLAWL